MFHPILPCLCLVSPVSTSLCMSYPAKLLFYPASPLYSILWSHCSTLAFPFFSLPLSNPTFPRLCSTLLSPVSPYPCHISPFRHTILPCPLLFPFLVFSFFLTHVEFYLPMPLFHPACPCSYLPLPYLTLQRPRFTLSSPSPPFLCRILPSNALLHPPLHCPSLPFTILLPLHFP